MNTLPSSTNGIGRLVVRFLTSVLIVAGIASGVCAAGIFGLGPPVSSGYSVCPTAFYVSGLFMVTTGGLLGWALLAVDPQRLRFRLNFPLVAGAVYLGVQAYGIWCLRKELNVPDNSLIMVALILSTSHFLSCVAVFVVILFGMTRVHCEEDVSTGKFVLRVCAGFWYLLGFTWIGLLCLFAALL